MKTILLTGCTGFLGSHLLRTLLKFSEYKIIALKRSFSNTYRIIDLINDDRIRFVDIDTLNEDIQVFIRNSHINIIIHTATSYGRTDTDPTEILQTNLIFPLTLLEAGVKNELELFINTDSYFNKPNQSYKTLLDYSLSKKSFNIWLEYLSQKTKIVNLRLEHMYGDYDSADKFVEYVIQKIAIKQNPSIALTHGQQKRDFVFIDDVCTAFMSVLINYEKYHFHYLLCDVGTGMGVSVFDFVTTIKHLSESKTELQFGALPYREDEIMSSVADNSVLLNWGWNAFFSYKEGIRKILGIYNTKNISRINDCE